MTTTPRSAPPPNPAAERRQRLHSLADGLTSHVTGMPAGLTNALAQGELDALRQLAVAAPQADALTAASERLQQTMADPGLAQFTAQRFGPEGMTELRTRAEWLLPLQVWLAAEMAVAEPPSDETLRALHRRRAYIYSEPAEVHAAHIVKHPGPSVTSEQAKAVILQAQAALRGGQPWEEVASKFSDCPQKAGDLGFFKAGVMVERFEEVVFKLAPGLVSEPFETEHGWHLARVLELRPARLKPFESVRDELLHQWRADQVQQRFPERATAWLAQAGYQAPVISAATAPPAS
jgi:parvulin-like peptidyl-prolyl isomerase